MTKEEFLKDVCPNHTEKSKWNRSELLHILDMHKKQLSIPLVSNRYFVFSGQEDNKPTKYLVDDCKDRETAIAKIETEYPNFKWVMTETFNGC